MADTPATMEGLRVLDLSRAVSGPLVGRVLADLGADVVKVEPPEGDVSDTFGRRQAARSGLFAQMNAGKRNVRLDLHDPADLETARALATVADVVIENYRAGVLDRLGLGYDALAVANPGVVLLSISGFGGDSPEASRRAYAPVLHAESGMLVRHARMDDRPPTDLPLALADTFASLHGTIALLAALRGRERTGRGQHIDLSMLDAVVASDDHVHHALDGEATAMPSRGEIWAATGGPVLFATSLQATWALLTRAGAVRDDGPPDVPLHEKVARRRAIVAEWVAGFSSRDELLAAVEAAGVVWADLRAPEDLLAEASLRHRPPFAEVPDGVGGTRRVVRMPYRFSDAPGAAVGAVAHSDEHAAEVRRDWLGR